MEAELLDSTAQSAVACEEPLLSRPGKRETVLGEVSLTNGPQTWLLGWMMQRGRPLGVALLVNERRSRKEDTYLPLLVSRVRTLRTLPEVDSATPVVLVQDC